MTQAQIETRRRWQKIFDETFPTDGVNLIFVEQDQEPEESDNNLITPRMMVHGVSEDDVPYVIARPAIGLGFPTPISFAVLSMEDHPSPGRKVTFSKMLHLPYGERIWVLGLHAEGARKACLETRRGEFGYYFSDAFYDSEFQDVEP